MSESEYKAIIRTAELLATLSCDKLNAEDAAHVDQWRTESPENERLYREIVSGDFVRRKMRLVGGNDVGLAYTELLKLVERAHSSASSEVGKSKVRNRGMWRLPRRWAVIAAVLGIVWLSVFQFTERSPEPDGDIVPGSVKAVLTIASGQTYDLTGTENNDAIVAQTINADITAHCGQKVECSYSTITVPRGGEYSLKLKDGTTVWLNAESEIRIPEPFNRSVEVIGEVFFEVVSDPDSPFTVKMRYGTVTVTGTSFNVRDYADEVFMEATLVDGCITFGTESGQSHMVPGEQLRLDKASGQWSVMHVDTRRYILWKDDRFVFEKERLEDIMWTLARWYDIEVVFENPSLKDIEFSGNINKYTDFDSVLEILSLVNKVDMETDGRRVIIKP